MRDNGDRGFYHDINHSVAWPELCSVLIQLAFAPYKHKADAPLFSPTVFSGLRRAENATTSGLAVIDADGGLEFDAAVRLLTEYKIEAILHTTASNTQGDRFHILVPLLNPVDPETHKAVVKAICAFLKPGWKADTSKNNCYSLFYFPGTYSGAKNEFSHIEGAIFSAEAWLELGDAAVANGHSGTAPRPELRPTQTTWNSSFDCPYVDQQWVQEYLNLTDDFYNGLYQFMCRVALSGFRQGVELTPLQLAEVARDVERMSGRTHRSWDVETRKLEDEAVNALVFARAEIAQTPSSVRPQIAVRDTGMSFLEFMMSPLTEQLHLGIYRAVEPAPKAGLEWDAGLDTGFIEPRQWLLGNTFCRRYVSTIIADGGTGKTALRMAQAVALATGRPITGEHVFRRCRVLYVSLEDDGDEMRRRIKACCIHHKIEADELRDHLFAVALANGPKLALLSRRGAIEQGELGRMLAEIVERRHIDLVLIDPFIKSHGCEENDNNAIDFVTGLLAELAIRLNIAVDAPHHVAKGLVDPGNANRGRGASAFKDAARLVYTLSKMTQEEAKELGVDECDRWRYVRVDSGKVNIAPAAATAKWFKLVGVPLGNASITYPSGDEVQTVEPWTPVDLMVLIEDEELRDAVLNAIKNAAANALYTGYPQSRGRHICEVFKRHVPEITKRQATKIIDAWKIEGLIEEVDFIDHTRHKRKGLAVCR